MPGSCSICDSSNTDCALSVTGPYESTAIVTGPIPRKPNATRPNAKTACTLRSSISEWTPPGNCVLMPYAAPIRDAITTPPIQNALKLPAVNPDRMFRDAPPSRLLVTTSRTCGEWTLVKIVVTSGMIAPASVPHVMMLDSFHHSPSGRSWISRYDATYVHAIEMSDAIQTSDRSGDSKFIVRASLYLAVAIMLLTRYAAPLAT